jgi:hypothetical protein
MTRQIQISVLLLSCLAPGDWAHGQAASRPSTDGGDSAPAAPALQQGVLGSCSKQMGITFPSETQLLGYYKTGLTIYLKIRLPQPNRLSPRPGSERLRASDRRLPAGRSREP